MMERKSVKPFLMPLFVLPPAQAWIGQGSCSSALSCSHRRGQGKASPTPRWKIKQREMLRGLEPLSYGDI